MHFMRPVYRRSRKGGEEKRGTILFFWGRKEEFRRARVAHL